MKTHHFEKKNCNEEKWAARVAKEREFLKKIPPFSGKTYKELNDIYPISSRINDEMWRVVCLMKPAYILTLRKFKEELKGQSLRFSIFMEMCWMQRCEESKQGLPFSLFPVGRGLEISNNILAARKAELVKLGLIEQMPFTQNRMFRVTALGKLMIKTMVENMREIEARLVEWNDYQDYDTFTKEFIDHVDSWTKKKSTVKTKSRDGVTPNK
jgi:hypothetical protein